MKLSETVSHLCLLFPFTFHKKWTSYFYFLGMFKEMSI